MKSVSTLEAKFFFDTKSVPLFVQSHATPRIGCTQTGCAQQKSMPGNLGLPVTARLLGTARPCPAGRRTPLPDAIWWAPKGRNRHTPNRYFVIVENFFFGVVAGGYRSLAKSPKSITTHRFFDFFHGKSDGFLSKEVVFSTFLLFVVFYFST